MKKNTRSLLLSGLLLCLACFSNMFFGAVDDVSDEGWGQSRSSAPAGVRKDPSSENASSSLAGGGANLRNTPTLEQLEYWRETMLYGTPSQKEEVLKSMQSYRTKEVDALLLEFLKAESEGPNQRRIIQILHERQVEGALAPLEDALRKAEDPATISATLAALAKFKDKSCLPLVAQYLTNDDINVQQEAVRAIGAIGDPEPAARLLDMLDNLPVGHDLRHDLVNALGDLRYAPAYDALRATAMNTVNGRFLRSFAITALGKIGDKRIIPDFLKLLSEERNPDIKLRVVAAFGEMPSEETIPAIRSAMADTDEAVRAAAVTAAGKTRNEELVKAILYRFRHDSEARVMLAAAEALQEYGYSELPALILARFEGTRDINIMSRFVAMLKKCPPQSQAVAMLRKKQDENKFSKIKDEIQELLDHWGVAARAPNTPTASSRAQAQSSSQSAGGGRVFITD